MLFNHQAKSAKSVLYAVLLLGFLGGIQTLDPIISSIALVDASKALHFSASTIALASGISTLALAATVITTGLMADRLGRQKILMGALLLTVLGDVIVAVSFNSPIYLFGRVLAGIGLGAVFGSAFAYIRAVASDHVGSALGQFSAMGGITTLIGGLIGGNLVTLDWRIAYLMVPALSLIGFVLIPFVLPKVPKITGSRIDYPGIILIGLAVIGILYGVSNASSSLSNPSTWLPILVGVIALIGFVINEHKISAPVFPIELLKNPIFVGAALTVLIWNFSQSLIVLQISNLWQYIENYSPTMVTFGQLPLTIMSIATSILVGKSLAKGRSARSCILIGLLLVSGGFSSLVILPHGNYLFYLPSLILIGLGLPYAVVPSGQLFMSQAPEKFFGAVTSSKTTIGQFGYALGLAGSMVLINNLTDGGITQKLIHAGVAPSQTGQGLDAVSMYADTGVHASTQIGRQALEFAAGSYTQSFSVVMLIGSILAAGVGILVFMLLKSQDKKPEATS